MSKDVLIPILCYFGAISFFTIFVTASDKMLAKKNKRRVPERILFAFAFLGGSVAEYITMLIIRHKTLHKRFMIGLPVIIILQIAAIVFAFLKINQII